MNEIPDWKTLSGRLDWAAVKEAIKKDAKLLYPFDFEDAEGLVRAAGKRFLAADLMNAEIGEIEERRNLEPRYEYVQHEWSTYNVPEIKTPPLQYVVDMGMTLKGRLKGTEKYAGKRMIVDWKTSKNDLDQQWRLNLRDSWQWKIYSRFENCEVFAYRGLSRKGEIVEVIIDDIVPKDMVEPVDQYLMGIWRQMEALQPFLIWPQNMPRACGAYGRDCPHRDMCAELRTPPRELVLDKIDHLSHSSIERFLLCPEKFRLSKVLPEVGGESEETEFGLAVHRGMAEMYEQGRKLNLGEEE